MASFLSLLYKCLFASSGQSKDAEARCFLIMSNARSGSSYFQSSLSAMGAVGDFEFALRPYGTPMPHQKFICHGILDVATELQKHFEPEVPIFGSKLTIPIYDFLSDEEIKTIVKSCRNISRPIHLVRHYWDLLKSNLSRGVAHDFNPIGKGWSESSYMHQAYANLPVAELGPEKQSVFVGLPEEDFKKYLTNLIRNDFAFSCICNSKNGIRVNYESLQEISVFKRVLDYLEVEVNRYDLVSALDTPILRKLPTIPDSNIPHESLLREVTACCYQYFWDEILRKKSAQWIYEAQRKEIDRLFS
ncbi:MAG: hypothetical protein Q7J42_08110 [Sulfuritalea sp.]|nr:hypothetical protein [Sulfuritalea sp.]